MAINNNRISPKNLPHLGMVSALLLSACGSSSGTSTGTDTNANPSKAASTQTLSYADAFPEDRVRRLDITISAENWQKMLADMTDLLGAFGANTSAAPGGQQQQLAGQQPAGGGGAGAVGPNGMGQPTMNGMGMLPGSFGQAGFGPMMPGGAMAGAPTMPANFSPDISSMQPMGGGAGTGAGQSAPDMGIGQGSVDLVSRTPVTVECDINSENLTLHHVGIRFKGNSSLAMPWQQGNMKLPLRLKFDAFEDTYPETKNQRYYGFKDLSLSNGQSDPSLLRDKVGTELFVHAGFAAPASAYYRVYIDHGSGPTYFGLYTGIELPQDDTFLERWFVSHDGNLYKPDGVGARFQTYDEATLGKENNEVANDFTDVRGLYDALHSDRSDAAAWRARLESTFRVDVFLHWLALNTVAQDWDSYGQMPHNYYLYGDPNLAGQLVWIPWDHSYAFTSDRAGLSLGMTEVTEAWPLIRYLLDDPAYAETYRNFVAQAASEEYEPNWALARFQSAHDLIKPYVVGETGEVNGYGFVMSEATFDAALDTLSNHVKQRQSDVAAFLAQ